MTAAKRQISTDAVRYLFSGGLVYLVDLGVFSALTFFAPAGYEKWNLAGRVAGAVTGFFLHRYISFRGAHRHAAPNQALRYLLVLCANLALSALLLWLLAGPLPVMIARVCSDVIVILISFIASRQFVFVRESQP